MITIDKETGEMLVSSDELARVNMARERLENSEELDTASEAMEFVTILRIITAKQKELSEVKKAFSQGFEMLYNAYASGSKTLRRINVNGVMHWQDEYGNNLHIETVEETKQLHLTFDLDTE